jgi:organic radical activating enzyme
MERFYTIQGEGFYQGCAAYFIRLGGCDVGCVWCDVKESWDAEAHPHFSVDTLAEEAHASGAEIVVVTGGEPLMHDLTGLTDALHRAGLRTHIETSGSWPVTGSWDWICVSPKKFKAPLPEVLKTADELKVIVYNRSDFEWAEKHAAAVKTDCKRYLQPEWSKRDTVMPLMVDYIKAHPQWTFCVQIHKYINVP